MTKPELFLQHVPSASSFLHATSHAINLTLTTRRDLHFFLHSSLNLVAAPSFTMAMASASRRAALSAVQSSSLKLSASLRLPYRFQPCRHIAVMVQGRLPLRTRSFATEAAPSEAPKKTPAKKTKGKSTGRKLKAKPKKKAKAKPKPKPKRKVLTSAQKELLERRRQRAEIASLKEQALSLPYMKAASAYKIYMKQQLPTLDGSPPEKVRQIGEMWKNLPSSELEVSPSASPDALTYASSPSMSSCVRTRRRTKRRTGTLWPDTRPTKFGRPTSRGAASSGSSSGPAGTSAAARSRSPTAGRSRVRRTRTSSSPWSAELRASSRAGRSPRPAGALAPRGSRSVRWRRR
jgi:hypothetical protein